MSDNERNDMKGKETIDYEEIKNSESKKEPSNAEEFGKLIAIVIAILLGIFIFLGVLFNIADDDCDVPYADYDGDGSLGISDYDTMRDIEDDAC